MTVRYDAPTLETHGNVASLTENIVDDGYGNGNAGNSA